ncbi:lipocalin-like domain-containing protein [Dyadobacter sandarakinus]|uniref:Lipocalin family protein n=1 Tax=Dyadobacter sandarakinus TaxID=2747268 RepID=A0ABX7I1X6_9BACT|nr:lipocalin family protein [Dyadobacter sandarakinus]QRQ99516.1 lipocalin family protein [Dyadobacter sandarakinus]
MHIRYLSFAALLALTASCNSKPETGTTSQPQTLAGTWFLHSSQIIEKGDTVDTFPVKDEEMIKTFTDTHFTFMKHDTRQGKGDSAVFSAGAGTYTLKGEDYTEKLQYCNYREWENHDFQFKLRMHGDTIIQTGEEKIDSLGINREIREVYVRK